MTISRDAVYAISDDVVAREIEGEIIMVPLVAGIGDLEDELFTLNETGKAIWEKLDGRRSLNQVIEELAARVPGRGRRNRPRRPGPGGGTGPPEDTGCRRACLSRPFTAGPGGCLPFPALPSKNYCGPYSNGAYLSGSQARGFSMHPFIRDGDVVTISPRQAGEIAAGGRGGLLSPGYGEAGGAPGVGPEARGLSAPGRQRPRSGWPDPAGKGVGPGNPGGEKGKAGPPGSGAGAAAHRLAGPARSPAAPYLAGPGRCCSHFAWRSPA